MYSRTSLCVSLAASVRLYVLPPTGPGRVTWVTFWPDTSRPATRSCCRCHASSFLRAAAVRAAYFPRSAPVSVDSVHPHNGAGGEHGAAQETCATSMMELCSTITMVVWCSPHSWAMLHRLSRCHRLPLPRRCSLTAGCTPRMAGSRRPTLLDVSLMPATRQSSAAACWRAAAGPAHRCALGVAHCAREEVRLALPGNLHSLACVVVWLS